MSEDERLQELRNAFARFERSLPGPSAPGALSDALDYYLDITEDDQASERSKGVAENIANTYAGILANKVEEFRREKGTDDIDLYVYWFELTHQFVNAEIGDIDKVNTAQIAFLRMGFDSLSKEDQERFLGDLKKG